MLSKREAIAYEQEMKELPIIEKKIDSKELKQIFGKHIQSTKNQQTLLKEAFTKMNFNQTGQKSLITESIFKEAHNQINNSENVEVCDACIVSSLQQLGHRKVADLGALSSFANEIGQESAANMLHNSLEEEKKQGRELIDLAKNEINKKAATQMTM